MYDEALDFSKIFGIIPHYENGVNGTNLLFVDGQVVFLPSLVRLCLDDLALFYDQDIPFVRRWVQKYIDGKLYLPLIFKADIAFIPVKTRVPVAKSDGCIGYIRHDSIHHIDESFLTLHNNLELPILFSREYMKKKEKDVLLLYYIYVERRAPYDFMRESAVSVQHRL